MFYDDSIIGSVELNNIIYRFLQSRNRSYWQVSISLLFSQLRTNVDDEQGPNTISESLQRSIVT